MDSQATSFFKTLVEQDPENAVCFDCGVSSPQWASLSHGILICLLCSGVHRSLGVNISFVRSVTLDSWTSTQLAHFQHGGNSKCKTFFMEQEVADMTINDKYNTKAAVYYRALLKSLVEGTAPPQPLLPGMGKVLQAQYKESYNQTSQRASRDGFYSSQTAPAETSWSTWGVGALTGLWGTASNVAQNAASAVTEGNILESVKSVANSSVSWVGEKGRNVVTAVKDEQFWAEAQEKAAKSASQLSGAIQQIGNQAENWLASAMGDPVPFSGSITGETENVAPSSFVRAPTVEVTSTAVASKGSKESQELFM